MKNCLLATSLSLLAFHEVHGLKEAVQTDVEMVVSAHHSATEAGEAVLAAGGTAVDAMIAVQTVLGLVEPQSSGIGGGAFVVYYDAANDKLTTFDGREKAPSGATEERFVGVDNFFDAWQSGLSVGVPGVPRLMEAMHQEHGNQEWASLFQYAKDIAIDGWEITGRTEGGVDTCFGWNADFLSRGCEDRIFFRDQAAYDYFVDADCVAKPEGTLVVNQDYADMMDLLASEGADGFYTGDVAADIVAKAAADRNPTGDATISLDDLTNYEVIEREPVCKEYRGMYNVCGMGPPSSGALAVGQILGILEKFDLNGTEAQDTDTVHLFTQAGRLAFADRGKYVADSDFITVPVNGMLDSTYLAERAALIEMAQDMGTAEAGTPPGLFDPSAPEPRSFEAGTSHISIIDQFGNALSMTTTVESFFGSGLMVRGFLLNNQITDFSFSPKSDDDTPIANRVQPNKRPRSSMSPTIVLDANGKPTVVTGSPGGSRIIGYTAQSLVSILDYGMDPQQAANMPHYQNRNGNTELEEVKPDITSEYDYEALKTALEARGHTVTPTGGETSGLSIIKVLEDGGFLGGSDPRRDGSAGGRMDTAAPTQAPTAGDGAAVLFFPVAMIASLGAAVLGAVL